MPYLQLRDSRYPLAKGEARVGRGESADIKLPAMSESPERGAALALVTVSHEGTATIRKSEESSGEVIVNGLQVGSEPAPLLHGDRIALAGCELRYADENLLGETIDFPIASTDHAIATPSAAAAEVRAAGRLLSLVDGREYQVPEGGLSIGRDAACDIVIASPEVSRRHAEIRPTQQGYALLDRSSNGVLVNGNRVWAEVMLGRGDMIRVGREEFRFYAEPGRGSSPQGRPDVSTLAVDSVPSLQATGTMRAMGRPPADAPVLPGGGAGEAQDAPGRQPATARKALATLEVINAGPTRGMRFELATPLSNIGRGEHNDVVVGDESVSESHAKIQRREGGWFVVDMGSTNGTYVNGERITGEAPLATGSDVRFGGVKMTFRPTGGAMRASGGTRVIVGLKGPDPKRQEQAAPPRVPEQRPAEASGTAIEDRAGKDSTATGFAPWFLVALLVALVIYTVYLAFQGR
ncbi:MAG: FHA domain-containing protein [Gemmatimonadota bacterium]